MKPPRSLKSRALQLLAQREQSRVELRRKLMAHARADDARANDARANEARADEIHASEDAAARVDEVLGWLEAHQFMSDARFAESRVNARVARYGNLRIRQELKQHAVTLTVDAAQALKESELARALSICERRFEAGSVTQAERARQGRFLSARGFSPDTIQRVFRLRRDTAASDAAHSSAHSATQGESAPSDE